MGIPKIPNAEELKQRVSLVDVIGSELNLKKQGHLYKARCPFHADKDPSFTIYPSSNSFFCFGACREGGDVFDYLMKRYNLGFPGAVQWVSDRVGSFEPANIKEIRVRESIPIVHEIIDYYHAMLDKKHREYFHKRGFTDVTIDRELWGWTGTEYALPVWDGLPQESEVLGVRLRRVGSEGPKYRGIKGSNSPQLYSKWAIEGKKIAWITFGEFDAMRAIQDGWPAVSPTSGCSTWRDEWNQYFTDKEAILVIPDQGEEYWGYKLQGILGPSRTRVCPIPFACGKDYCEFRYMGFTPEDLLLSLEYLMSEQRKVKFDF